MYPELDIQAPVRVRQSIAAPLHRITMTAVPPDARPKVVGQGDAIDRSGIAAVPFTSKSIDTGLVTHGDADSENVAGLIAAASAEALGRMGSLRLVEKVDDAFAPLELSPDRAALWSFDAHNLTDDGWLRDLQQRLRGEIVVLEDSQHASLQQDPDLLPVVTSLQETGATDVTGASFIGAVSQHAKALGRPRNIEAFVQWVLRESYLLNSMTLSDFGERVKFINNQREEVREYLQKLRLTKSEWTTQADGDRDNFVAASPVAAMILDDNGKWVHRRLDQKAARKARARQQQRLEQQENEMAEYQSALSQSAENAPASEIEKLWGGSRLPPADIDLLNVVLTPKGNKTDNVIIGKIDALAAIIPKMNADELTNFFEPLATHLRRGHPNWPEFKQLYEVLTPSQRVYVYENAAGYPQVGEKDGGKLKRMGAADEAQFELWRLAAYRNVKALGIEPSDLKHGVEPRSSVGTSPLAWLTHLPGLFGRVERRVEGTESVSPAPTDSAEAPIASDAALERDGAQAPQSGLDLRFVAGAPENIDTLDGLDDYIEDLEGVLNTLGEDGQLANVDLQNALQRQQQILQTLSNIGKSLHETAMSIIRKMGS